VLLCGLWQKSEIRTGHLATPKGLEDARRGHLPGEIVTNDATRES